LVAITVGVVEYESHPALPGPAGGLPGRGVPALLAGGWIAAPPAPEAGETASVPADDRRVAAGVLPVRKPVTAAEPPDLSPPAPGPSGAGEPGMGSGWLALPSGPGSVADTLQVLDPTQVDQRPVPASRLHPNYPMEMRRRNISGEVLVDFIVDADGRVRHAVAASSSRAEFERAALEAVSGWRFSPGRKNGRPVAIHLRLPILFTLDSHD